MEKDNWAFNFDLFQGKLLEEGFINPLEAYHDLGNALAPYGFEKRQQSSYFSINDYNESDIYHYKKSNECTTLDKKVCESLYSNSRKCCIRSKSILL